MNLDALNLDALRQIIPIPLWQKLIALAGLFVLMIAGYFYLGWVPLQDTIDKQQQQVDSQRILLRKNQMLARDLPRKRQEFDKLEKQLKVALNMLPRQSQIPDLLENVSWAGKDSGLDFSVFTPNPENAKQIYAEVPVSLSVTGSFKQLLTFLKRVGEMSRIVAVKNLRLSTSNKDILTIQGNVMTYRFVEESQPVKNNPKRKKR